jgi:hypothetical protein
LSGVTTAQLSSFRRKPESIYPRPPEVMMHCAMLRRRRDGQAPHPLTRTRAGAPALPSPR